MERWKYQSSAGSRYCQLRFRPNQSYLVELALSFFRLFRVSYASTHSAIYDPNPAHPSRPDDCRRNSSPSEESDFEYVDQQEYYYRNRVIFHDAQDYSPPRNYMNSADYIVQVISQIWCQIYIMFLEHQTDETQFAVSLQVGFLDGDQIQAGQANCQWQTVFHSRMSGASM